MKLLRQTVLTPFGLKQNYRLPDSAYGQWLVNEDGKLRYLISVFDTDPVSATIQDWMQADTMSFEEVLLKINRRSGLRLAEHGPAWGVMLKQEVVDVELEKLPLHFVQRRNLRSAASGSDLRLENT